MEWTAIVVAVISAAVAVWSLIYSRRAESFRAELQRDHVIFERDVNRSERRLMSQEDVTRRLVAQREPMIEAVDDLLGRVGNIRGGAFLDAYAKGGDPRRARLAILSTMYRLGKYFATVEVVRRGIDAYTLEQDEGTTGLAHAMSEVSKTFATDEFEGLMVWREEQRAIGGLMVDPASLSPIGFAEFFARYETDFREWFAEIEDELSKPGVSDSPRLDVVEGNLQHLRGVLESWRAIKN